MSLHLLAIGAHPDDVEIGMGATLAKYVEMGYRVGICDLTMAELSSNGTVERRQEEAKKAAALLGVNERIQLDFPDRGLRYIDDEDLQRLVSVIRKYKPTFVFAPYHVDRHPDHGACAQLVKEAVFNAGIHRYRCSLNLPAHRVRAVYYYFINSYQKPDFLIDVSKQMEKKKQALLAYKSQFIKDEDSIDTPLTNGYLSFVDARERLFGKEIDVTYAEGFLTDKPIAIGNLFEVERNDGVETENRD